MKLTIDAELRVDVSKLQTWIPTEGQLAPRTHPHYTVCHISAHLSESAADSEHWNKINRSPKSSSKLEMSAARVCNASAVNKNQHLFLAIQTGNLVKDHRWDSASYCWILISITQGEGRVPFL